MKKTIRILLWIFGILALIVTSGILYLKLALPRVSPAPDLTVEITRARLARGKYLATHVALCTDCHSVRDFSRFGGPITEAALGAGGERFDANQGFPGVIFSRNITPHNLGSWTDGDLYRLLTTGVRKNGEPVFPLMNYAAYATMPPEELYSVIAFVRSLNPVVSEPPETTLDFPVNLIMRTLPKDATPAASVDTTDILAYGKYLVTIANCSECHTPREKGQPIMEKFFAGGAEFKFPGMVVRASNITPDKETGIGNWDQQQFVSRFKSPEQPHHAANPVKEGEFNTIMPWRSYSGMREKDLEAIFAYLQTLTPISNKVQKFN